VAPPEAGISGPPAALRAACGGVAPPRNTRLTGGSDIPVKWDFISAGWYNLMVLVSKDIFILIAIR
jgi:hypothetical protein